MSAIGLIVNWAGRTDQDEIDRPVFDSSRFGHRNQWHIVQGIDEDFHKQRDHDMTRRSGGQRN